MTVTEIFAQAKALNPKERKELVKLLVDTLDADESPSKAKTGAEIVALLQSMNAIEFVDSHIEDPVEWLKHQRQKRANSLKPYWDEGEE